MTDVTGVSMSNTAQPSAYLHPYAKPASGDFRTLVRGKGSTVWDDKGNEYIDAMASLWYCNAGHGDERITSAVTEMMPDMAMYNTFDPWTNEAAEAIADRLAGLVPIENARIFLTSSGSEAVDSAIKIARIAHHQAGNPQKQLIVSREHGYHGVTFGGLSAQGLPANQAGFGPLVGGFVNLDSQDVEPMAQLFAERGDEIAAVIAEPIQGAGGVHPPSPGYLEGLRRLCDDHGAYLILDEVICGFGRLGTWFGAHHYGVTPDLITFAKGVSSGYIPLGGVAAGRSVCDPLEADPSFVLRHGHTYSGHPVACAAGLANIDAIAEDGMVERAPLIGKQLSSGFDSLVKDGTIAGYRGVGAIWAAELNEGHDAIASRDRMLDAGVIARPLGNALAFCPPLIITDDEIGTCIDVLAGAVGA